MYSEHMGQLLSGDPKHVLRKTIILGLGHIRQDDKTTETILHQFKSDKEEIQIAVLDALKLSNRYETIQFLGKDYDGKRDEPQLEGSDERGANDCITFTVEKPFHFC